MIIVGCAKTQSLRYFSLDSLEVGKTAIQSDNTKFCFRKYFLKKNLKNFLRIFQELQTLQTCECVKYKQL